MADMGVGEALLYSALISAGTTAATTGVSIEAQHTAANAQKQAQLAAEAQQKAADERAEKQRLEALAANQTATDYSNVWGTDSAKYADAAQKLSAGTGGFDTDEDETNPFYTRGLL